MDETRSSRSASVLVVIVGILAALLLLFRVFEYMAAQGLPMGVVALALSLGGAMLLGSAGRENYMSGIFLMLVGMALFADLAGWLADNTIHWITPVILVLVGLLILIFKTQPK